MNRFQDLWWQQAKSDYEVWYLLAKAGVASCHCLHYLQMTTEKIAKAYFWRSGSPPPRHHSGFVVFLRNFGSERDVFERQRIALLFGFKTFDSFQSSIRALLPTAYALEKLAPALAQDGPNPEYPWPHSLPTQAPVSYHFRASQSLATAQGRDLLRFTKIAVMRFPQYA